MSFPSLLSHMTSMHLNGEVLVMPVVQEKTPPPALRSFQPFSAAVPCDFHLLNLRMLQGEVSGSTGAPGPPLSLEGLLAGWLAGCPWPCPLLPAPVAASRPSLWHTCLLLYRRIPCPPWRRR